MNKVTAINLNGRAYQIEESGYEALRTYLDQAEAKLHGNPDKDEIMEDFEQALADKCDEHLQGHKNVITAEEIALIIGKMGPVDTGRPEEPKEKTESASAQNAPKRLYQIREGAFITGVCTGVAAYFNLDVTLVRAIFIILALITHGGWILAYLVLTIVMPVARTEDDITRAHGLPPTTSANEFIEQAKQRYAEFKNAHERREWKRKMREMRREWKRNLHDAWHETPLAPIATGIFVSIIGLILAAITVIWIFGLWSLMEHGTVLGLGVPAGHLLWIPFAFISAAFYLIATPLWLLIRNAQGYRYNLFSDIIGSVFFAFALYALFYTGRLLFPSWNEAWSTILMHLAAVKR